MTEGARPAVMNNDVDACARMGLYDEAKGTVDAMRDAGQCAVTVRTYNFITAAARAGARRRTPGGGGRHQDITPTDRRRKRANRGGERRR